MSLQGRTPLARGSSFERRWSRYVAWHRIPVVAPNRTHPTAGVLTALTQPSPEALREAIRETRRSTDKPFGVNITFLPTINPPDYEGYARAAVEEGVRIFETAGNNRTHLPTRSPYHLAQHYTIGRVIAKRLIAYLKGEGCTIIHKCTTVRHAKVRSRSAPIVPYADYSSRRRISG